jgi:hypothetical protein
MAILAHSKEDAVADIIQRALGRKKLFVTNPEEFAYEEITG